MASDGLTGDACDIGAFAIAMRETTAREFDAANSAEVAETLQELQKIRAVLFFDGSMGCDLGVHVRFDAFALAEKALNVLVSAFQMARQRAQIETMALLRVALEAACMALHIVKYPNAYADYTCGKYKSTKAITSAKLVIPLAGTLWGAFSNLSVHPNVISYGPRIEMDADSALTRVVSLAWSVRSQAPGQDRIALYLVSLVALIELKILEIVLSDEAAGVHGGWRELAGGRFLYFNATDKQLEECYQKILALGHERGD